MISTKSNQTTEIRNTSDLRDLSFILRNLFRGGSLSAAEILSTAGSMVPKYRDAFNMGAKQISTKGWSLSQCLNNVFPASAMAAIRAGEESGRLGDVFDQIWKAAILQEQIDKLLRGLITPALLIVFGTVISLAFFVFLIPMQYRMLAKGASSTYEPGSTIVLALAVNDWIVNNAELALVCTAALVVGISILFTRIEFRDWLSEKFVSVMISIKPLGESYANLKFGIMAQYLNIMSLAGLDADRRVDLAINVLPRPLRPGITAFRREMLRGIAYAAKPDGRPDSDPRHSLIFWPIYMRMAFRQSEEGSWEEPMKEFGTIMIESGKENLARFIAAANTIALLIVSLFIILPIGLLYGTLGEILYMRMQMI